MKKVKMIGFIPAVPGWYAIFKGFDGTYYADPVVLFECAADDETWDWRPLVNVSGEGLSVMDEDLFPEFEALVFSPTHQPVQDYLAERSIEAIGKQTPD